MKALYIFTLSLFISSQCIAQNEDVEIDDDINSHNGFYLSIAIDPKVSLNNSPMKKSNNIGILFNATLN